MRRLLLALALVGTPAAHAASLVVVPRNYSPAEGALSITGAVRVARPIGVQLATVHGRSLGWLEAPQHGQLVSLFWDGRINGALAPDGYYKIRLVAGGTVLATAPIRLDTTAPTLATVAAANGSVPFAGDNPLLTTISPNGDDLRDRAQLHFRLTEPATVTLDVSRAVSAPGPALYQRVYRLSAGAHTIGWKPAANLGPRTYLARISVADRAGNSRSYGADSPFVGRYPRAPVIRLLGIDASLARPSYAPGQTASLRIATDAPSLTLQVFHAGPEHFPTYPDNVMNGIAVSAPTKLDWSNNRNAPGAVRVGLGPWPSGLYYAQLTAPDGRIGYAPFVLRPPALGTHRIAVVLPANTWQAYNFWDSNGDGWGETWYVGAPHRTVELGRPYLRRGVIPFFRRYDLGFLHWLSWSGKDVDYLADSDLETVPSGDALARAYDLVVFPGHSEYVTEHLYDVVQRYRDLGGNLAFLSANNFFWRVSRDGNVLRRAGHWRDLGRPEGSLIGVQYIANDEGHRQGVFMVANPGVSPWLWDKTGLESGGTFGAFVGGYGIEIDATGSWSPPGTQVVAEIPNLFGPGKTAQMTYYETTAGAKVFAAGALDFGGSADYWPVSRILENLWARLSVP